jgi:hypothetical protein
MPTRSLDIWIDTVRLRSPTSSRSFEQLCDNRNQNKEIFLQRYENFPFTVRDANIRTLFRFSSPVAHEKISNPVTKFSISLTQSQNYFFLQKKFHLIIRKK